MFSIWSSNFYNFILVLIILNFLSSHLQRKLDPRKTVLSFLQLMKLKIVYKLKHSESDITATFGMATQIHVFSF